MATQPNILLTPYGIEPEIPYEDWVFRNLSTREWSITLYANTDYGLLYDLKNRAIAYAFLIKNHGKLNSTKP